MRLIPTRKSTLSTELTNPATVRAHNLRIMCLSYSRRDSFMNKELRQKRERMIELRNTISKGLKSISFGDNWFDAYEAWCADENNQFSALLIIQDPFATVPGDSILLETGNESCEAFFQVLSQSVFFSKRILQETRSTVERLIREKNRQKKLQIIHDYIDLINTCQNSVDLAPITVFLHEYAEQQTVLQGKKQVDLYVECVQLLEAYRFVSVRSIYIQYTLWRLDPQKKNLKRLVDSFVHYIRAYFSDYGHDPEMHLDYPLDDLTIIKKLPIIMHWIELITFHTKEVFDVYKDKQWLLPIDSLVDDLCITNQISKFEMLRYKTIFSEDDQTTVKQKAVCNHSYGVWIKTTDIIVIFTDILRILYENAEEQSKKLYTTKAALLELYDNMLKLSDAYQNMVFTHRAFYQNERRFYNPSAIETSEEDAITIGSSIDDVLQITSSILSNDIDELMSAKQRYRGHLSIYMTEDQEKKLDEYMEQVAEKIKDSVSKFQAYDEMYASITDEFQHYASHLLRYPKIFASLVSAEYLYSQYISKRDPNENFDYSCISIMYYLALEDFANKLLYTSYANDVLIPNAELVRQNYREYISSPTAFCDNRNRTYKQTSEIGNMGFLLAALNRETNYSAYLSDRYPEVDLQRLKDFGTKLKDIAPRRNEAAHGDNLITYNDVQEDKRHVFDASTMYRGLILELLNIIFG